MQKLVEFSVSSGISNPGSYSSALLLPKAAGGGPPVHQHLAVREQRRCMLGVGRIQAASDAPACGDRVVELRAVNTVVFAIPAGGKSRLLLD